MMRGKNRNRAAVEWWLRNSRAGFKYVYIAPHYKGSHDIFGLFDAIILTRSSLYCFVICHKNNLSRTLKRLRSSLWSFNFYTSFWTSIVTIVFEKKGGRIIFREVSL